MDWQTRLVTVYVMICDIHDQHGFKHYLQRESNNKIVILTDEEVLTIFLFGVMSHRTSLKTIYAFASNHLCDWFPNLITYEAFVRRIDQMGESLPAFIQILMEINCDLEISSRFKLIDSFPIVMAKPKRRNQAKVAPEIANIGFCATKNLYYYGVKIHILASDRDGSLPVPEYIGLTSASEHDLSAFRAIVGEFCSKDIFCDKAYCDENIQAQLKAQYSSLVTPIKLKKGQKKLDSADKIYSSAVSSIRQPIEALFSWIQEKTGIQCASKVRSYKGLMVHVFGKLAASIMLMMGI
jgi:hypothetical protein